MNTGKPLPEQLCAFINANREPMFRLLRHYAEQDKPFLLQTDLWDHYQPPVQDDGSASDHSLEQLVRITQEAAFQPPWAMLAIRYRVARWSYLRFNLDNQSFSAVDVADYLAFKEQLIGDRATTPLEIDFGPFEREFSKMHEARSIGRGVEFLNRRLSSELFENLDKGDQRLLSFLTVHQHDGRQLLLNPRIKELTQLRQALRAADDLLAAQPAEAGWDNVGPALQRLGLEPGWGRSAANMRDTLQLLQELLEAPTASVLETFLSRIPMIFRLAILSPHGYFGQQNVLGLPDTGGQIVYILDQVRALERGMRNRLQQQGMDIEPQIVVITRLIPDAPADTGCDQPLEAIAGTAHARILRVPFRDADGEVLPQWISRFEVWPYLEQFAQDAQQQVVMELGGRPDLIIGNYSDGNLVASIMAGQLKVTHCTIAHALEKAKYLMSDLYWQDNEPQYHFAAQFTADLIAMNTADFIITSSYQEIAGREDSVGQYESYAAFTMPGLYRVVNGINLFDPKFNIVSPGADAEVFFPWSEQQRRHHPLHPVIDELIYGQQPRDDARGILAERDKPLLFSMARLDRIKNISGLLEWYGQHPQLREQANLLIVAGHTRMEDSQDAEEREQIERMHVLMEELGLDQQVRWLGVKLDKTLTGELYRMVADSRGAFVQPALFEAFGLTVIEAMASGLPTFATRYGGPLEIIEHGQSGFHIDPNHGSQAADLMADFLQRCQQNPQHWQQLSEATLLRVNKHYTWDLYAERMMTLSRVYGFWKHVTNLDRAGTHRYLEMLHALQFRPLADSVPHR